MTKFLGNPNFGLFAKKILPAIIVVVAMVGCSSDRPVSVQAETQAINSDVAGRSTAPAPIADNMVPLLIRMADSVPPAQARALFKKYNCNIIQQIPPNQGTLWSLDAPKTMSQQAWITLMQNQPGVTSAEVDLTRLLKVPLEQ